MVPPTTIMTRSHFTSAVTQSLILTALSEILQYHLLTKAFAEASNSQAWQNFTRFIDAAEMNMTALQNSKNITVTLDSFYNSSSPYPFNVSSPSNYSSTFNSSSSSTFNSSSPPRSLFDDLPSQPSFYLSSLPRTLFISLVLLSLQYFWSLWLERAFPARPRQIIVPDSSSSGLGLDGSKDSFDSESREEAVIRRWVAQGRVRRASLSWWNTFVKWILEMTIGQIWVYGIAWPLVEGVLDAVVGVVGGKGMGGMKGWGWWVRNIKIGMLWRPWVPLLGIRPLAVLLSFVVVPAARRRIVFVAGADLVWNGFLGFFMGLFLPWFAETEFVKVALRESERQAENRMKYPELFAPMENVPDEL